MLSIVYLCKISRPGCRHYCLSFTEWWRYDSQKHGVGRDWFSVEMDISRSGQQSRWTSVDVVSVEVEIGRGDLYSMSQRLLWIWTKSPRCDGITCAVESYLANLGREFKYRWERNQGFEIWKLSAPKKCNPSSGVSDTENIARKNPVRRCI